MCRFLLCEAQLSYVLTFKDPRNITDALINSVPTKLFDVYKAAMDRIAQSTSDSKTLAIDILSWIFHAKRPLRMIELQEAVAVRKGDGELVEDDLMEEDDVVEVCGSLVGYDKDSGIVRFSHEVVRDFLNKLYFSHLSTEVEMAKKCLIYLMFDTFEEGACPNEESFKVRIAKHPFGQYAAKYWGIHTKGSPEEDSEIQMMLWQLTESSAKLDSMTQLSTADEAGYWERERRHRGRTLIHIIAENNLTTIGKIVLTDNAGDVDFPAETGDTELRGEEGLVNHGKAAIGQTTSDGWTALHFAANKGYISMVEMLLSRTADISAQTNQGWTSLHMASFDGHVEIVKLLLDANADVSRQTDDGPTALHFASFNRHVKVVKLLLDAKADVSTQSKDGRTALHVASSKGHAEVVKILLDAKADVSAQENSGWTPLHLASFNDHVEVVKMLLDAKADVSAQENDGWTAFHLASSNGHVEVVKMLLEVKADVSTRKNDGWTALHLASSKGHIEVVEMLLNVKADVSTQTKEGSTVLHFAAINGHMEVVKMLLDAKADVSTPTDDGRTALHFASFNGQVEVVKILLDAKADVSTRMNDGWTPLHVASCSVTWRR